MRESNTMRCRTNVNFFRLLLYLLHLMRTLVRSIVSALIFSADNKLLMGRKDPKDGGVYSNCWHIPGGGVGQGEDKTQALIREIKEEVGIDISKAKIEFIDNKGRGKSEKTLKTTGEKVFVKMLFNVYKIIIEDKRSEEIGVHLHDDLKEYKWFSLSELSSAKLTLPSIALFIKLGYI